MRSGRAAAQGPSEPRHTVGAVALVVVATVLGLVLTEGGLRLYEARIAGRRQAAPEPYRPDPVLGHRPLPDYPGHDGRGWRNASALERADIVSLGDSQTYGVNADREDAWPQALGRLLERSVYQMAYGGYGPGHYVPLVEEALALRPAAVVAAYYFGNDVYDGYLILHRTDRFRRTVPTPALDRLASTDGELRRRMARAEAIDPGLLRHRYLDCQRRVVVPDARLQAVRDILDSEPLVPLTDESRLTAVPPVLSDASVVARHAHELLLGWRRPKAYGSPICVRFADGRVETTFSPAYRVVGLDRTDPRVEEGERVALLALAHVATRCREAGCRLYVVLIPTKETAFRARTETALRGEPYMIHLWTEERRVRARVVAFLEERGIPVIDTLGGFERLIASDVNPYPSGDADGHPTRIGYETIARSVAERLASDGFMSNGRR